MKIERYFDGPNVKRELIAKDIKLGRLKKKDIVILSQNELIKGSYFENKHFEEIPFWKMTQEYLEVLTLASIGEVFTKEYLFYLLKVRNWVETKKATKMGAVVIGGLGIIAMVVYAICCLVNK